VTKYCFLTTLGENLTLLYTFTFAYSILSVIDELLRNVCKFRWILLNIKVDRGRVQVMNPLKRDMEQFRGMQDMLHK
jgi:hypothetical protein